MTYIHNSGHLRWDSLGEYLALQVSLEDIAAKTNNVKAQTLARALEKATCAVLENRKGPSRKVKGRVVCTYMRTYSYMRVDLVSRARQLSLYTPKCAYKSILLCCRTRPCSLQISCICLFLLFRRRRLTTVERAITWACTGLRTWWYVCKQFMYRYVYI